MRLMSLLLLSGALPAAAAAQQAPPVAADVQNAEPAATADEMDGGEEEEIVVTGTRPRGSVIGDIDPEVTLNARDIRAYGAGNLGELLEELAPLTGSIQGRGGGGQPVVLLGGRRISSFREIRDLPPEAVVRVDVLPEEVALKYGFRADQKVVNFVLRRRFEAVTAELEAGVPTDGGRSALEADVNYLRLAEGSRLSIDGDYERSGALFETERDLVAADPDRTLLPRTDDVRLGATYNRTILGTVSATLNAALEGQDSLAALGRSADGRQRLLRDGSTRTGSAGYALNGDVAGWRWSLTGTAERTRTRTLTDRDGQGGVRRDSARSTAQTIESEATANGDLARLPAGAVTATLKAGVSLRDIESRSLRAGVAAAADLSRDEVRGAANIDLPILRSASAIGRLSANLNGTVERLSDFGTLTTVGGGFNWEPVSALRLIGSVTREDGAPTIRQLGDPIIVTPNVRVLDLTTGQTVDVTRIDGGNADLLADSRRVLKLGATLRPIRGTDLTLLANYTDTRTRNPIASFPTATPEIEAAFRERFERDADGVLVRIDARPVNFASTRQRQMRWGINWSEALEAPPPRGPDGQPLTAAQIEQRRAERRQARAAAGGGDGPPGGGPGGGRGSGGRGFGGPGFGGPGGGFGGGRQGRVQLSLFHTFRLEDTILIRPGVPELDLLDGSATGGRGGASRHELELRAGYNRNGIGARLNVDWQSATRVLADPARGASSPGDLRFGSLTTVGLRLFADLGQQRELARSVPFLRGARVTLAVDNLFDSGLRVRDAAGLTPIGFQPDLLDPLGQSVRISFRKLFF